MCLMKKELFFNSNYKKSIMEIDLFEIPRSLSQFWVEHLASAFEVETLDQFFEKMAPFKNDMDDSMTNADMLVESFKTAFFSQSEVKSEYIGQLRAWQAKFYDLVSNHVSAVPSMDTVGADMHKEMLELENEEYMNCYIMKIQDSVKIYMEQRIEEKKSKTFKLDLDIETKRFEYNIKILKSLENNGIKLPRMGFPFYSNVPSGRDVRK